MASVVIVGTDLMFTSKVTGTALAMGVEAVASGSMERLHASLDAGGVRLVLVDMALPGDFATDAIRLAAGHATRPTTIAFFSHVQSALAEAARAAGVMEVMPRSRFSQELPALLARYGRRHDGI